MASYIGSADVKVFPSAFRTEYASGKYTNEENFVGIINSLADYPITSEGSDGFIVDVKGYELTVIIHGYLFKINNYTTISKSMANVWLAIRVENGVNNSGALVDFNTASINLDENSLFKGLVAINETVTGIDWNDYYKSGTTVYKLKITDNIGKIYERNYMKFSSKSITFDKGNEKKPLNDKINDIDLKDNEQTAEINKKQNILKPTSGGYIESNNNAEDNIKLTNDAITVLNSFKGGKGSITKPVYVNANGEIIPIGAKVGKKYVNESNAIVSQNVYFNVGDITPGYSVYASINAPNNNIGQDGDFWFRYE